MTSIVLIIAWSQRRPCCWPGSPIDRHRSMARYRATFTERTRFQAQEFFLFIDPQQAVRGQPGGDGAGRTGAWLVTGSVLIAIPVFFALALLPALAVRVDARTAAAQVRAAAARCTDDAHRRPARRRRPGLGHPAAGQRRRAAVGQEFALLLREQRLGVTLEQSLTNLARRVPTQTTTLVVSAMRIASETGGGLAETLERTAHTIRSRLQMEGKIGALTAQGKLQAWVVGLLPVLLMLVLDKMEPEAMRMLWHTPLGWATLVVIAFLEVMGVFVIRKIIAIDV